MRVEQHADRVLHRLVVDAEDEIAEHRPKLGLFGVEDLVRGGFVAGLGRDPQLQPSMPLARNASVGLPAPSR